MREIKFRAKSKESIYRLKIKKGKWIYGYSLSQYESDNIEINGFYCDPDTLCEYTGLKDKNGKEIYEGDILQDICDSKYPVVWVDCCFKLQSDNNIFGVSLYHLKPEVYWEVVGNIFDNPELLTDK